MLRPGIRRPRGSGGRGRPPPKPRQLLLVNLLTDIAPAIAIATRPPDVPAARLLAEGPESSLGRPLEQAIATRALATTVGATAAWTGGRLTGRPARARTIGLVGLVGSQLGQTLRTGVRNPRVLAASIGSAAALATVVQTPGLSHFFGCVPLGPVAWTIALASAAGATATAVTIPYPPVPAVTQSVTDLRRRPAAGTTGDTRCRPAG